MNNGVLHSAQLEQLSKLSSCVVASAIETFGVRLENTGFTDSGVKCVFPEFPPVVGYAATARVRSSKPPMEGGNYYERVDWWKYILSIPAPRVIVIQDLDRPPGLGAFVGDVHANILMALGCTALVTNGGVRDLPEVRSIGFQMFAGNVSVSHAYAHVSDFGGVVELGGLQIKPGDLLQGDMHGVQTIPLDIAAEIPRVAEEILRRRQRMNDLCRSAKFSVDMLNEATKELGLMRAVGHHAPMSELKRVNR